MRSAFQAVFIVLVYISFLCRISDGRRIRQEDVGYFWHVTDMHWDPTYQQDEVGWSCGEGAGSTTLGEFGDYLCDPPWKLINSSVYAMRELEPDPDFLIWTGDDTPHIWNDTILNPESVFVIIRDLTDILQEVWPNKTVYSALGNHDWSPKNQLPPNPDQFYDRIAGLWRDWLPDGANETFFLGAYYSLPAENADIRIVVLNTNLYYDSNSFTDGMHDPANQLQWMDDVITQADEDGKKVMLVAHVPPGMFEKHRDKHWFYPFFNNAFLRLVKKHANTIGSVHLAHHHTDSFRLLYNDTGQPVVPMFLAPAVSPWETTLPGVIGGAANNPSIRLVEYDRTTGATLDVHQYYLNLPKANEDGFATWELAYKATEYFELDSMDPKDLDDFAQDWLTKKDRFDKYYRMNGVLYDPDETCDGECMFIHYCAVTKLDYEDFASCLDLLMEEPSRATSIMWSFCTPVLPLIFLFYCLNV